MNHALFYYVIDLILLLIKKPQRKLLLYTFMILICIVGVEGSVFLCRLANLFFESGEIIIPHFFKSHLTVLFNTSPID